MLRPVSISVVAINAAHRMRDQFFALVIKQFVRVFITHGANFFEAFLHVSLADESIRRNNGSVTLQAGTGLLLFRYSTGLFLIRQHECMSSAISIIQTKCVAGKHALEPCILV